MSDTLKKIDEHPIPLRQEEFDHWLSENMWYEEDDMVVSEFIDKYTNTIAENFNWRIFTFEGYIYIWNKNIGEGLRITNEEHQWEEVRDLICQEVDS